MVSKHVEGLFSAAYDGELSADARAAFDRHLAECPDCAAGFAQLTTAVDALRELGPARMPRPVRLPEGSPIPERRLARWPAQLPRGRGLVAGLAAAGMVAVAGGVTAVLVTRDLTPVRSSSALAGPLSPENAAGAGTAARAPSVSPPGASLAPQYEAPAPASEACAAPQPLGTGAASAAEIPAGFANRDTKDDGFTTVVLATQAGSFAPGATVDIYARLIDDSDGAVYLPCTLLEGPVPSSPSSSLTVPAFTPSATPLGGLTVDGQPLLEVTLPASAVAGETFQVVVAVPAGAGEAVASEVSLPIQVT
jgi:hypothetical protein